MPIFSNTKPLSQMARGMQQNIQRLRGLPRPQPRTPPPPAPQVSPAPLRPQPPVAQQLTQQQNAFQPALFESPEGQRRAQEMQQRLLQQNPQVQQFPLQQPTPQQLAQIQQMAQQVQPIQGLQASGQGIAQMPMVPGNLPLPQPPMAQQLTQQQMQEASRYLEQARKTQIPPTPQQAQLIDQMMGQQMQQQMLEQAQIDQMMRQQQQSGGPGFTPTPGIMPMVPAQLPQPLQQGIGAVFQQQQRFGQMPPPFGQSPFGQQQAPAFGGVNSALQSAGLPTFQQLGQQGFGQMPPPFGQSSFGQPQQQGTPLTSQSGAANAGGKGLF